MILAFSNQKGGVGKSTTVYHLTRAAVLAGKSVLVIDADPQGNTTSALTDVQDGDAGVADALSAWSEDTLRDVLVPGIWEGVTVAPTSGDKLAAVRNELVTSAVGSESRLRKQLDPIKDDYDLVLIDCAPSIDPLTVNALTVADAVVIVTQSKKWSLDGLALLLKTVGEVRDNYNPALAIAGLVVNLYQPNESADQFWIDQLEAAAEANDLRILEPYISKRTAIANAIDYGQGLDEMESKVRPLADIYAAHLSQLTEGK